MYTEVDGMINIGSRRECFFDDFLIDTSKTSAEARIHKLQRKGVAIKMDKPWEGSFCGYHNIIYVDGKYRMYYRCYERDSEDQRFACAESIDGITWIKPELGIVEIDGSKNNNVIMDTKTFHELGFNFFDGAHIFYDTNPKCSPEERYKMVSMWCGNHALVTMSSADGFHFEKLRVLTTDGEFDSHNLAFWDEVRQKYFCYFRGEHKPDKSISFESRSYVEGIANTYFDYEKRAYNEPGDEVDPFMRDIRVMESEDFITWTPQQLIKMNGSDVHLYTNGVMPYPRAPHIFTAIPTRYYERKAWTPTYDELCGSEKRLQGILSKKSAPRCNLAVTDAIFMTSRDGHKFTRYDEAIVPPLPEYPLGWCYGSTYVTPALIETPSDIPGADNEYTIFVSENYASVPNQLQLGRYTIRLDGFVSRHADGEEKILATKEFIYDGDMLFANIETSAWGHAYFTLKCEGKEYTSYGIFGNSVNKKIHFMDENAVRKLSGKAVTLEIRMVDCDIYGIKFEK